MRYTTVHDVRYKRVGTDNVWRADNEVCCYDRFTRTHRGAGAARTRAANGNAAGRRAWFLFVVLAPTQSGQRDSVETENDRLEIPHAATLRKRATTYSPHGRRHIYLRAGLGQGVGKEFHRQRATDQEQPRDRNRHLTFRRHG